MEPEHKNWGITNTTIWNILKTKETTRVLRNRQQPDRPRKTIAVDDRKSIRAVKKNTETTVIDITNNLQSAGVKVLHHNLLAELQRLHRKMQASPQDASSKDAPK